MIQTLADRMRIRADYVNELPMISLTLLKDLQIKRLVSICVELARNRTAEDLTEWDFSYSILLDSYNNLAVPSIREGYLLSCEAIFVYFFSDKPSL